MGCLGAIGHHFGPFRLLSSRSGKGYPTHGDLQEQIFNPR